MLAFLLRLATISALVAASSALTPVNVFACLNPIGQRFIGEPIVVLQGPQEFITSFTTHKDQAYWKDIRAQIMARQKNYPSLASRNDLAVALVHLGEVAEAIEILKDIEAKKPGIYATAANLGTAYELNAEDQEALKWIRESIKRDSGAHGGSEWLHVRILETKLKLKGEPNWLANQTVLGAELPLLADSTESNSAVVDHLGQAKTLREIESALVYQLHERLEFIKPPEPVVADLLVDLSAVFSHTQSQEHARLIHELAKTFGAARLPPTQKTELHKEGIQNGVIGLSTAIMVGFATFLLFGFAVWRFLIRSS